MRLTFAMGRKLPRLHPPHPAPPYFRPLGREALSRAVPSRVVATSYVASEPLKCGWWDGTGF